MTGPLGEFSLKIPPQTPGTEMNVYKTTNLNKVLLTVFADKQYGSSAYVPIPVPPKAVVSGANFTDNKGTVSGSGNPGSMIRL